MPWTVASDRRAHFAPLQCFQQSTSSEQTPTIGRQIAKTISVLLHSLVYDKAVFNKLTESTLLCPRLTKEYVYEEKGAYFRTDIVAANYVPYCDMC